MSAKELRIEPIEGKDARSFIREHHYSGKVTNSQIHLGVFLNKRLEGCLQFGPSIQKSTAKLLVKDTGWNNFIELNRMAMSPLMPRNSESRALAIAMRILKKNAPHLEWVLSFSDGTQSGDGTIYRASGFHLIGIKKNREIWRMPDGEIVATLSLNTGMNKSGKEGIRTRYGKTTLENSVSFLKRTGAECLPGFQLRYIYPLNATVLDRLTVPILPFSTIDEMGARMYRGERPESIDNDAARFQRLEDGATPISGLQNEDI